MLYHMTYLKQIFKVSEGKIKQAIDRYGVQIKRIERRTYFNIPDYKLEKIRYFIEHRKELNK